MLSTVQNNQILIEEPVETRALFYVQCFQVADMYDVAPLKHSAVNSLEGCLDGVKDEPQSFLAVFAAIGSRLVSDQFKDL